MLKVRTIICIIRMRTDMYILGLYNIYISIYLVTLKALPHQWVGLDTAILQSLRSRMLTSSCSFFLISLLMVSIYIIGLMLVFLWVSRLPPWPVLFLSYGYHLTCPYQRSRFCFRRLVIGWSVAAFLYYSPEVFAWRHLAVESLSTCGSRSPCCVQVMFARSLRL